MKDSISRWSLHYGGWAAEHNISCLPRGNRSRGKGLSLLSPCRGGAPPFSPALPSYSVSLLFLLFAPAVTKPHSGRFSSAFRPFCSANPAAGSRNMHRVECVQTDNGFEFTNRFSNSKRDLQTLFEKTAAELGIRHKLIRPYTPRHMQGQFLYRSPTGKPAESIRQCN